MDWQPDRGLQFRMVATIALLCLIYLGSFLLLWLVVGNPVVLAVLIGLVAILQLALSDRLTKRSFGATRVDSTDAPELHQLVERLAHQADVPKPEIAIVDAAMPNSFVVGRSTHSVTLYLTQGLLDALERDELEAVIAHELAHVKNRDAMVLTVASFLATVSSLIGHWSWQSNGEDTKPAATPEQDQSGIGFRVHDAPSDLGGGRQSGSNVQGGVFIFGGSLLTAPLWVLSFLAIRALSRYREFAADRAAGLMTGEPAALASALRKMDRETTAPPSADLRQRTELNALFIVPVTAGLIGRIARTHPETTTRIERLERLQRELEG